MQRNSRKEQSRKTVKNATYQMKYTKYPCNLYGTYYDSASGQSYDDIEEGFADSVPHTHAELELLHVTHGDAIVEIDGSECTLHAEDLLLINPFETHRVLYTSQRSCYGHFRIRLRASLLLEGRDPAIADTLTALENGEVKFQRLFPVGHEAHDRLLEDFQSLFDLTNDPPAGWEFGLKSFCYGLFFHLIQGGYLLESTGRINALFSDRVTAYVEAHCTEDISVADAAAVLGYSKSYFCRLFRETMRTSFTDFLHLTRVNRARRRMANGETNISRLATEVGFNSLSYFTKIFHRCTGETPSAFCRRVQTGDHFWDSNPPEDGE